MFETLEKAHGLLQKVGIDVTDRKCVVAALKKHEETNQDTMALELEDGTEQDCAVIALFSVEELDDQEYIALITVEDLESDDEEGALLLYRYNEDPEDPDTFSLDNIETDEEYETVTAVLDEILEDEE